MVCNQANVLCCTLLFRNDSLQSWRFGATNYLRMNEERIFPSCMEHESALKCLHGSWPTGVLIQVTPTKSLFQINFNFYRIIYTTSSSVVIPVTFYMKFCEGFSCFMHVLKHKLFNYRDYIFTCIINTEEITHFGCTDVDSRITLKCILVTWGMRLWTEFS